MGIAESSKYVELHRLWNWASRQNRSLSGYVILCGRLVLSRLHLDKSRVGGSLLGVRHTKNVKRVLAKPDCTLSGRLDGFDRVGKVSWSVQNTANRTSG